MVAHLDGLLPIKSRDPLILWSCEIMWQTKTIIFPLSQCLWPNNLIEWWIFWRAPDHKVTQPSNYVTLHVTSESHCITTNRVSIAAKLYRMRKYSGQFLTVKTSYGLITWSCKVKWQTRIIIYPQPTRVPMDTNLAEW